MVVVQHCKCHSIFHFKIVDFIIRKFHLNNNNKRIKNTWIICVVVEVTKNEDISRDREGLSEPGVKLSVNGGERLSMKSLHLYCPNGV